MELLSMFACVQQGIFPDGSTDDASGAVNPELAVEDDKKRKQLPRKEVP
jgi:hypothetical protein